MARPSGIPMSRTAWDDITRLTGRTMREISEIADTPRSSIAGLYNGHAKASPAMAVRIANALGVHPETLFPGLTVRTVLVDEVAS